MKYLPLIWKSVWRKKFRTIFTMAVLFVAFVLFGVLMALRMAFSIGVEIAGADRLVLIHKVSLIMPLPIAYQARIQAVPGVTAVTHNSWFGGSYQNTANAFATIVVDPEPFIQMYPEYKIPPDQMKAWLADRQGVMVGRVVADRYGWKVGDRVPLRADIWRPKQGDTWEFNISGIYDGDTNVDKTQFFFRYDYFNENRASGDGLVGWFIVKVADPSRAVELARQFDAMFENSAAETKTTTEKGFIEGFAKQIGDIGSIMIAIATVVLAIYTLVAGITMSQSVRERTSEIAVLKTLGFTDGAILALVLGESLFIAVLGGGLGLLVSWGLIQMGDPTGGFLPIFAFPPNQVAVGAGFIVLIGLVAGVLPALAAMRLRITDALRRN